MVGPRGCGKTAFASKIGLDCGIQYVKVISPETLVNMGLHGKLNRISHVFDSAYKCENALVIIDDIEQIINFTELGNQFCNEILSAILVYIRKRPSNPKHKIFVLGTTSKPEFMGLLDVVEKFDEKYKLGLLETPEEKTEVIKSLVIGNEEEVSIVA